MTGFSLSVFLCVIFAASAVESTALTEAQKNGIVTSLNAERKSLLGTNMMKVRWSNARETEAGKVTAKATSTCYRSNIVPNRALIFVRETYSTTARNPDVIFTSTKDTQKRYFTAPSTCSPDCYEYREMIYAPSSEIGCTYKDCSGAKAIALACVMDSKYTSGPFYTVGNATTACTECPAGAVCDPEEKLCENPPTTTTTAAPTTTTTAAPTTTTTAALTTTTTAAPTTTTKLQDTPVCSSGKVPVSSALTTSLLSVVLYVNH